MTDLASAFGLEPESEAEERTPADEFVLDDGARVAVVGGGPAGSFTSLFLLDMAERMGLDLQVDLYEPHDYSRPGPAGCNHCGGIVSESLVQLLAAEGISLPGTVVQRGIDAYLVHMGVGQARIETPLQEKRIAAMHRGAGPRGLLDPRWASFDGFLQELAEKRGANLIRQRVDGLSWDDGRPQVSVKKQAPVTYDLLVGAVGINTRAIELFADLGFGYRPPETTRTYISEFPLGEEQIDRYLGNCMNVFLLNLPRLEFAALIPKGDFVTVCLLGEDIDEELVETFLSTPQVRSCLPPGWQIPDKLCHCAPAISVGAAHQPYTDRVVLVGDCGVTRLFKDGIGAAYRTAKAAATTAVFHGVSADHFREHYQPAMRAIASDNRFGQVIFAFTRQIQRLACGRRAVLRMVRSEQGGQGAQRMSTIMWDTFTGSAPYRDIFRRALHPAFVAGLAWHGATEILRSLWYLLPGIRQPTPGTEIADIAG